MYTWIINCSAVFLFSAFCAGIVIPQILLIAFRKSLFDEVDERKIHTSLVPRLGGIAFKPVIFFSLLLILGLNITFGDKDDMVISIESIRPFLFSFCAIILIYLVGIADDLIGVRYRAKFVAQILCAILLICGGISIDNFHGILGIGEIPVWVSFLFTILLVVFIMNAINLIDGIDGLASGLSSIACFIYGVIYFHIADYMYAMLAFATMGVLIQFFYYNVFGNPKKQKKIFMGDTGSLTIGLILAILSIRMSSYSTSPALSNINIMVLALSPLLIPCLDVVRVYLRRVRNGKNPFMPDRSHIHHKLLAVGLNQRIAMIMILASSLFLVLLDILLSTIVNVNLILLIDAFLWIVANIWLSRNASVTE